MSDINQDVWVLQETVNLLTKRITDLEEKLADMRKKCMMITEYRNADFWGITSEDEDE